MRVNVIRLGLRIEIDVDPADGLDVLSAQLASLPVGAVPIGRQRVLHRGVLLASSSQLALLLRPGDALLLTEGPPRCCGVPAAVPSSSLARQLSTYAAQTRSYEEDDEALALAASVVPAGDVDRAAETLSATLGLAPRDAHVVALCRWFKSSFFRWVDAPPCVACGGKTVAASRAAVPTEAERMESGGRVELFSCTLCMAQTRFVRYNSARKLLETRCGRCGEWANAFALLLRATGHKARLVLDWTDHVWCEAWSDARRRWVHVDPCEGTYDRPLTYERGWRKQLSLIVAFGADEVVDVTRRYTEQWADVLLRRTSIAPSEEAIAAAIAQADVAQRASVDPPMSAEQLAEFEQRRIAETRELASGAAAAAGGGDFIGRVSGSSEWKRERGEDGRGAGSASIPIGPAFGDWVQSTNKSLRREVVSFSSFGAASAERLELVGNAQFSQQELVLTKAAPDQRGAVWASVGSFVLVTEFRFAIRGGNGADGFAFVIQSSGPTALGEGGCQLGYGGISSSVAVEFDTYESQDRCNDPNGNHISVHTNGAGPNTAHHSASLACNGRIPPLADGHVHTAQIAFTQRGEVLVWLDGFMVICAICDLSNLLALPCWIGFTASTGGLFQEHAILSWSVSETGP